VTHTNASRPYDDVIQTIADYVLHHPIQSSAAIETARMALLDAIGCGIAAARHPACRRLLGPIVHGTTVPDGARVPGTSYTLDPIQATFQLGALIRWLDFNDTWLAKEWSHPSDNLSGLLMTADHLSRRHRHHDEPPIRIGTLLEYLVKAYEIQGVLALGNSLNRRGLDHVWFVKVATAAVVCALLGGNEQQVCSAVSQAWVDLVSLRTYRHAPNVGWRKSWAAGDAARRGVEFAWMAMRGEDGYPSVLTAPQWGVNDVLFGGSPIQIERLDSYVMEHVLFKPYPAEYHAQSALEAAIRLSPYVRDRWQEVERITIRTHESAIRIIDKPGPLHNPADRDHCLQFIVALGLLFGTAKSEMYEDEVAADPRIDALRDKMVVTEDPQYSHDYLDESKRSVASAVQVMFADGTCTEEVAVLYPLGHPRRRTEALPVLRNKFEANLSVLFSRERIAEIVQQTWDNSALVEMPVDAFVSLFTVQGDEADEPVTTGI
jgi:2-methylcitrate dehydratase